MNANEIQRQARNAVRKGSIADIDLARALCRVAVGGGDDDTDEGLVTNWIPWFAWAAGDVVEWRQPSTGEQVMLLCPMGDPAQGVALCGIYSDQFPAPANASNVTVRRYPDGSLVVYDHEAHAMAVTLPNGGTVRVIAPDSVNVETQNATVKASEKILLDGDVEVTKALLVRGPLTFESGMTGHGDGDGATMQIDGAANFTGVVTSAGVSLPGHSHREQGDGNLVSLPVNIEGTAP
ncbi:phage baseplate assembly protein V [Burkholderia sp. Bp8986]|uniref:phage baseplate assembly protein V n=1 Tax=Burkholderia sp. Bp8986 TaxID=2184550 RepID=UPI000F59A407|nr:phage baseplate assembly protein V [Burkholderia sp. Bp8986]RQS60449.1 phage baseplate assembly protein V [Burkholderia sp. Bp8986]